jgi:RNA polymerase sporulation-specific sigma factor
MKEYRDNDYELLYLISENNEDAKELFYKKYKPIIELKAKKFTKYVESKGYDYNDLIQEGMIGLSKAIKDFSEQKDVKFTTFANICIERQILSFMRNISAGRHKVLNESLSFDTTTNSYGLPLINLLDDKNVNPETTFIESEEKESLYNDIVSILNEKEVEVFDLRTKGFSYKEISGLLNITEKSVGKYIEKIKTKISKMLDENK